MNPLTQIKNTQKASQQEIARGVGDSASWHARFKHSAYIFTGGLPYDLTEGDLLAVFAQYGEIVDVNLVRDKDTGKSRGFAFLAYEDQRSTVLAVDNLSGSRVAGRVISVNHVDNYKVKRAEMEGREVSPDTEPEDDAETEAMQLPPEAEGAAIAQTAAPTGGGDAPWGNSGNSVFALLNSADAMPPPPPRPAAVVAAVNGGGGGPKKEKRHKKEKKEKKAKHGKKAKVDRPGHASSDSEDGRPAARRSPARENTSHHRSAPAPAPTAADQRPDRAAGASRRHEQPETDRVREDRSRERGVDRDAQRDSARRRNAERTTAKDREADRRSDGGRSRRDERREHRPRSRSRSPRSR